MWKERMISTELSFLIYNLNQHSEFTFYKLMLLLLTSLNRFTVLKFHTDLGMRKCEPRWFQRTSRLNRRPIAGMDRLEIESELSSRVILSDETWIVKYCNGPNSVLGNLGDSHC
jgi:hypothetical protein